MTLYAKGAFTKLITQLYKNLRTTVIKSRHPSSDPICEKVVHGFNQNKKKIVRIKLKLKALKSNIDFLIF